MIIESGIDIYQVLVGSVSNDDPPGLWIIGMDHDLRLLYVDTVVARVTGDIDDHLDDVEALLDAAGDVAYFALAWSGHDRGEREPTWLADLDRRLRRAPELAVSRFLGLIVFDSTGSHSSLPGCSFSLEPGYRDLPRALPIPGPHGPDCRCPLCADDRRIFDEAYDDRYGPASDTVYGSTSGSSHGSAYGSVYDPAMAFDRPDFDPISKRWYPAPARAGKRWTWDEEGIILRLHAEGMSCFDISLFIDRQPGAVAQRLNKLGESSSTLVPGNPAAAG